MNDAGFSLVPGLDHCKIMAPVCLHSSVIRGCVLNREEFVSIILCAHAHVGVTSGHQSESRGSLTFAGIK